MCFGPCASASHAAPGACNESLTRKKLTASDQNLDWRLSLIRHREPRCECPTRAVATAPGQTSRSLRVSRAARGVCSSACAFHTRPVNLPSKGPNDDHSVSTAVDERSPVQREPLRSRDAGKAAATCRRTATARTQPTREHQRPEGTFRNDETSGVGRSDCRRTVPPPRPNQQETARCRFAVKRLAATRCAPNHPRRG